MYAVLVAAIAWARARHAFSRPGSGIQELLDREQADQALISAVEAWDGGFVKKKDRRHLLIVEKASEGVVTAQELSEELGTCKWTIYRDVRELQRQGVPIIGEAGMGYMICKKGEKHAVHQC